MKRIRDSAIYQNKKTKRFIVTSSTSAYDGLKGWAKNVTKGASPTGFVEDPGLPSDYVEVDDINKNYRFIRITR